MSNFVLESNILPLSSIESDYLVIEIDDELMSRAEAERQNELVVLNEADGRWKLDLGDGFKKQWENIIAKLVTRTNNESDPVSMDSSTSSINDLTFLTEDKVCTISVLGDTSSGKSFIVRHLLDESQDNKMLSGPICIDEKVKKGSTTANINCYMSQPLKNQTTLVLDYEGEKGSSFPLLHNARRYLDNRDLACSDYLVRCREFALKANSGVNQMVYRPLLVIIQNKASLVQSQRFDVVTQKFFEIHGKEAEDLRPYFSSIKCFALPHKEHLQRTETGILDGEEVFTQQIADLKNLFMTLSKHHSERALTHAQWLYLLKHVLPIVQSGSSVSLHILLNEILTYDNNQIMNTVRRCFLYSYNMMSIHSPTWFDKCCRFAVHILAHCLAVEAYDQRELMSVTIIHEKCEKALKQLSNVLEEFQPCEALYTGQGRSSKNKDEKHPVYCYQHRAAHEGGHRTCVTVYGLSPWEEFWSWSSTDVWCGEFVPSTEQKAKNTIFSSNIIEDFPTLVIERMNAFRQDPEATYYIFTDLLLNNQFSEERLEIFSHICFCGLNLTSTSLHSDDVWNDPEHQTRRSQLGPITLIRNLLLSSVPQSNVYTWVACRKCYRKLDAAWSRLSINSISSPPQKRSLLFTQTFECAICFEGQRDFLFIPCGHRGSCENCADKIIQDNSSCPFCRTPITGKQRVHDV
ncbi:unnamed protein product [Rotaria sp. Silwood2]|nr:unnamed protein product [Rotaria sp. Silwood2]CAF4586897.1 unnamed protein product [Rotaria sp. Silwood2]